MKIIHLYSKLLIVTTLIASIGIINAQSRLFIKNGTGWNINIKFAEPKNTRAAESFIASQDLYSLGTVNDLPVLLSVGRSGVGSAYVSGFTSIDVAQLRQRTRELLAQPLVRGYERDIYWVILPTYLGWTAKVEAVQRLK